MADSANRLGMWSACCLGALGVVYALIVATVMSHGLERLVTDPLLAVMEAITLASAPLLVLLMAAVHATAPPPAKAFSAAALAFSAIMAGLSCAVHFVALSAGRQLGRAALVWPSVPYALELLAWDFFLGLSLLCAAVVFQGGRPERVIRLCLRITAILCLAATLGPLSGHMRLQLPGVLAYSLLLPLTMFYLGATFRDRYRARQGGIDSQPA